MNSMCVCVGFSVLEGDVEPLDFSFQVYSF